MLRPRMSTSDLPGIRADFQTRSQISFGIGNQEPSESQEVFHTVSRLSLRFLADLSFLVESSDNVSNAIEEAIIERFVNIPEIVEVYFHRDGDIVDVWTIVDRNEKPIRYAVYNEELRLRRALPTIFINFRVSGLPTSSAPASMNYRRVNMRLRRANAWHQ